MAQTADMPGLLGDTRETDYEGHKMPQSQGRRLPTELLLAIGDQLCSHRDIVAFGLTCTDMHMLLVKKKRPSLTIDFDRAHHACTWTATRTYRILNQWSAMLELPLIGIVPDYHELTLRSCDDCINAKETVAANQLFSQDSCRLAKSIEELTLSGELPYGHVSARSLASYPFIQSVGFKSLRPETFIVDLSWRDWDMDVLHGMSMTNLKILKLPVHLPSDCAQLGKALTAMPRLESLAITDIPDREEFLNELEHIGKGIISCTPTLRELDIEMTNYNRPARWAGDEAFIEPEEDGFFFRNLFAYTPDELAASCKRHSRHDTEPMNEAPLGLRKLRLKHVSLPRASFGTIFKAATIKHLQLPYSKADDQVWGLLQKHAQLDTLTDISYGMLSTGFLEFLSGQSSLKEISFARPLDQYETELISFYGNEPHITISVSEEAHRLGPDIGAKYPSLKEFLSSLEHIRMLKHLVLPADMYTITPGCLLSVAASLTGLEHLELGFDYGNTELQQVFASCFLCGTQTPKKLTFLSLKQPQPLPDLDSTHFQGFIMSLGDSVSANLKLVRYMPADRSGDIEVYYHRETLVNGERWLRLPQNECEAMFAEGRTPRIVPVGKWGWEVELENPCTEQDCSGEATSQASE